MLKLISALLLSTLLFAAPVLADDSNDQALPGKAPSRAEHKARTEETRTERPHPLRAARSQPEDAETSGAALRDVNYARLESAGLLGSPQDGSLGRDLWSNTNRSVITELIPRLPAPGRSRLLQDLVYGTLLSQTNASLVVDDISPAPGQDILTLRLFKMLDLGLTDKALEIYSALGEEPYDAGLAEAGILALLSNAEKSLACLEYKTVQARGFKGKFWSDIAVYCDDTLEKKKPSAEAIGKVESETIRKILSGGAYTFTYNANKLDSLPRLDRAVLAAEGIIGFGSNWGGIKAIAPQHVVMAMKQPGISKEAQFWLNLRAVQYGYQSKQDWQKSFEDFKFGGPADEQSVINVAALPAWQQLPAVHRNATLEKDPGAQTRIILDALHFADEYGTAALFPFARMISKINPQGLSIGQMQKLSTILHQSDNDIPPDWFDELAGRLSAKGAGRPNAKESALLVLFYMAKTANKGFSEADSANVQALVSNIENKHMKENFNIIIENIDKGTTVNHNPNSVYENDFDLTFADSYVMPSIRVWDRLVASGQNQSIGETVLLSTLVLNERPLDGLYPGLLSDILGSFRAVGLNRFSRELVNEALLEAINKN